jgi:hypothetical protein
LKAYLSPNPFIIDKRDMRHFQTNEEAKEFYKKIEEEKKAKEYEESKSDHISEKRDLTDMHFKLKMVFDEVLLHEKL